MDQYSDYLAVQVLNEKQTVTYRTLSRALKVHVNLAKQMLWDFHHRTNGKRPGSVHATYLLSGLRKMTGTSTRTTQTKDGDDTVMASSPPLPSSSMPVQDQESDSTATKSLLLVKEEHLDKAKATFIELRSIHVYSLQAEGLSDFQTLTKCTQQIFAKMQEEDPLKAGQQYGTIQNTHVKRRTQKTAMVPAKVAPKAVAKPPSVAVKEEPAAKPVTTKAAATKTASLKRQGSDIMASFSKTASAKPKPVKSEPEKQEDSPMADVSDEEYGDAADVGIDTKEAGGKSKQDRQAELEAMMDVEEETKDEPMEEEVETPQAEPEPEPQETAVTENGRRRGRRKVMKKKTVKDEDGYLVTKEEAVWESFSEDEPAPKKAKLAAPAAKKGGKPGQGNIMSFFSKK